MLKSATSNSRSGFFPLVFFLQWKDFKMLTVTGNVKGGQANINLYWSIIKGDFKQGHLRFFNQSETDSLTKNFDFAVFKANEINGKWRYEELKNN